MDDKLLELANVMRISHVEESSLTVRWVVVLSIVVAILAFLFGGFISNAMRLTKIETAITIEKTYQTEIINAIRADNSQLRKLVQDIRDDQIRRQIKEGK